MNVIKKWMLLIAAGMFVLSTTPVAQAEYMKFQLDTAHTNVGFVVTHLVITKVRGKFNDFNGSLWIDPKTKEIKDVVATVKTASVDTDNEKRDKHLRSDDFFNVSEFPNMTFQSTKVTKTGDSSYEVEGNLTIRGITKKITLTGAMTGIIDSPTFGKRAGFEASAVIDRTDFNINWNKTADVGVVVSNEVEIVLEVEAIHSEDE